MSLVDQRTLENNEFRLSDVPPGSAFLVGDVAVFNVGGSFCATQNKCTHREGPLSEGRLAGSTVTCPRHGAQFNVCTGAVLRGPAQVALSTYRVAIEGDVGRVEIATSEEEQDTTATATQPAPAAG
jgi:3-phenylpropionate/trans-cinnamate dioxygenase ferredoxin component